jgi:hypothetical protein
MIAIFGYMTCWQTRRMLREQGGFGDGELGYDFTRRYSSLEGAEARVRRPGVFARRRARRAARRAERERKRRDEHQQAVEAVLRKVSESGLPSLTARERRVLEQETQRQRTLAHETHEGH